MSAKSSALAVLFLLLTTFASAQPTTVHVLPVTGNPTASGTNLLNALAGILDNSSTKPYVLKLDPGIYDVGTTVVQMKSYVDIEGSGQQSTIVRGPGNNDLGYLTAIVKGAYNCELRNLQVLSQGAGFSASIAVELPGTNTAIRDVTLNSSGATDNWGLRNISASPTILNVGITVSGGTHAYAISNTGGSGSTAVIKRAVLTATDATSNYGIYNDGAATAKEVRDVKAVASGGSFNYGFYTNYSASSLSLTVENSSFYAASNSAYGIYLGGSNPLTMSLIGSQSTGFHSFFLGGTSYGIWNEQSGSYVLVDQGVVYGVTQSLHVPFGTARVGASRLSGTVSVGTPSCAASYNGSYVALGASCV